MKVTIVMCEGPHDVAFLSRIMHVDEYHTFNEKINGYPEYIKKFFLQQVGIASLQDLNLKEARGGLFLPSFALFKDDCLLLLYSLKGDSHKESRNKIVSSFGRLFKGIENGLTGNLVTPQDHLSILYFYDADDKGIDKRLTEITNELMSFLGLEEEFSLSQGGYVVLESIKFGAYVFAKPGSDEGRLEDLLLPLMRINNDDIYNDVSVIVEKRKQREYQLFSSKDRKKDCDFNEQKASIGMMGQLQKSGSPNSTIIEQSAFITDDSIRNDPSCQSIIGFVNDSFK